MIVYENEEYAVSQSEIAMIWDSVLQKGKYKQNYCDNCGQALDWSDENDL